MTVAECFRRPYGVHEGLMITRDSYLTIKVLEVLSILCGKINREEKREKEISSVGLKG